MIDSGCMQLQFINSIQFNSMMFNFIMHADSSMLDFNAPGGCSETITVRIVQVIYYETTKETRG